LEVRVRVRSLLSEALIHLVVSGSLRERERKRERERESERE
jgi:hypothetical protein